MESCHGRGKSYTHLGVKVNLEDELRRGVRIGGGDRRVYDARRGRLGGDVNSLAPPIDGYVSEKPRVVVGCSPNTLNRLWKGSWGELNGRMDRDRQGNSAQASSSRTQTLAQSSLPSFEYTTSVILPVPEIPLLATTFPENMKLVA